MAQNPHKGSRLCHNVVEKRNGDMFCIEWTKVTGLPRLKRTDTSHKTSINPSCTWNFHDPTCRPLGPAS